VFICRGRSVLMPDTGIKRNPGGGQYTGCSAEKL
jgi:hypothetical protein